MRWGFQLPLGRRLVTLRTPAITLRLPKAEHEAANWQATMEALTLVRRPVAQRCSRGSASLRALNRQPSRV
jgi:hypothetical protein